MEEQKNGTSGIFREKSIKRVSSPERLNDYIRVTTPSVWIILLAIIILLVGIVGWSIFGTVSYEDASGAVNWVHPISFITN